MAVTMKPRYAEIVICPLIATVSSTSMLYDQALIASSSSLSTIITNVQIAVPDAETTANFYFGQDANSAQNSETETAPIGDIEVTFTAKKDDLDLDKYMFGSVTASSGATRYNLGAVASSTYSVALRVRRTVGATTYTRDYLFQQPVITQVASWSAGSEDTKIEGDFKLKCPAKYSFKEYKQV